MSNLLPISPFGINPNNPLPILWLGYYHKVALFNPVNPFQVGTTYIPWSAFGIIHKSNNPFLGGSNRIE